MERLNTKVVLKAARLSYCSVFEPKDYKDGSTPKYSTAVLFDKNDTEKVNALKQAISNAIANRSERVAGLSTEAAFRKFVHDGDADHPDDESYAGMYYINAKTDKKPRTLKVVVTDGQQSMVDTTSDDDIYSGVYAHVSIDCFAYNTGGGKGVSCSLRAILSLGYGDRLSGGAANPEEDFGLPFQQMKPEDDLAGLLG